MKFFTKLFLLAESLLFIVNSGFVYIEAEEDEYYVAQVSNGSIEKIETYFDFYNANYSYIANVDNYDNLLLMHNDQILKMEYGVVEFVTNDEGTLNIGYTSILKNCDSSINGSFGVDGAYLYSSYDGNTVYFKISGDVGCTSVDDVILHPYGLTNNRFSVYKNIDGKFYHLIKTQFTSDYYSTCLAIDDKLEYLEDNTNYYSYDGHYFYNDFVLMINDYVSETFDNAINVDNPYYNYYEYLPYRSLTNYSLEEIESYYYDELKIKDSIYVYSDDNNDGANDIVNKSMLYGEFNNYYGCQNEYGVNALMLLSTSVSESYNGKSFKAFNNNNLFVDAAYESEAEKNNNRYDSTENSIYSYSKYYVSDKYSNYRSNLYYGNFLGNKLSGINASYKNDPYWAEKIASEYYNLDSSLGYKDINNYCLGIIENTDDVVIYKDENLKTKMMSIGGIKDYSLIILDETNNTYKVQVDPSFHSGYKYNFDKSVGYINKDIISYMLNKDKMHLNDLVEVKLLADEGTINGEESLNIKYLKGSSLNITDAKKDGYEFVSYKMDVQSSSEVSTYKANYKKIDSISIKKPFNKNVYINKGLDLTDSTIEVKYNGSLAKEYPITTSMIKNYNPNILGEQTVSVNYCGLSEEVTINVIEDKSFKEAHDLINNNIATYLSDEVFNTSEIRRIKLLLSEDKYLNSFEEIRLIDEMLLEKYRDNVNYRIDENKYDMSVSGLTLSLADASVTSWFKPFTDTYYVHIDNVSNSIKKEFEKIASAYDFEVVDYININYALNMKKIEQNGSMVISLSIEDKTNNKTYSVYRIDDNGDIIKCKTIQTNNKVEFITGKSGNFAILAKDSVNEYNFDDYYENISIHNSDPDNHRLFLAGGLLMGVIVVGFVVMVVYYRTENKRNKLWKEYKKSLQKVESAQEEKPKN